MWGWKRRPTYGKSTRWTATRQRMVTEDNGHRRQTSLPIKCEHTVGFSGSTVCVELDHWPKVHRQPSAVYFYCHPWSQTRLCFIIFIPDCKWKTHVLVLTTEQHKPGLPAECASILNRRILGPAFLSNSQQQKHLELFFRIALCCKRFCGAMSSHSKPVLIHRVRL